MIEQNLCCSERSRPLFAGIAFLPTSLRPAENTSTALRDLGELQEIAHEVDWNLEIGAVTAAATRLAPRPSVRRIKGGEPGFRVLGAPAGPSARSGNASPASPFRSGCRREQQRSRSWKRCPGAEDNPPISRLVSSRRALQATCIHRHAVDLMRPPTPLIHDGDGGRYITHGERCRTLAGRAP